MDVEASSRTSKRKKLAVPNGKVLRAPEPDPEMVQPPTGVDADGGDATHINDIPEALLGEIISLLPTEDGFRTQILSSRWRPLWLSAPLNLDCRKRADRDVAPAVITKILSSHQGRVRRLCVPVDHILLGVPGSDLWLRSPALENLEEIEFIYIENISSRDLSLVPLPPSIFRFSVTLRSFTLGTGHLSDDITRGLNFPLLTHLTLGLVSISDCSLHSLISGCPKIECLFIVGAFGFRSLTINSFTLRSVFVDVDELIIQNAPSLQRLLGADITNGHVSVVSAPKLEALSFDVDERFSSTNTLVLGSTVMQELPDGRLTTALYTVKTLAIFNDELSLDTIMKLMRYFPCVEKLYVWYLLGRRTLSYKLGGRILWHPKQSNPIASLDIPLKLKKIVLGSYRGKKTEANFARFFVLHAKELESMTLRVPDKTYNDKKSVEIQRCELQLEKRASKGAQFHFTRESDCPVGKVMSMEGAHDLDSWDPLKC